MVTSTRELDLGDVIRSDKFVYGYHGAVSALRLKTTHLVGYTSEQNADPATDPTRSDALWLVLAVPMGTDEGCSMGDASWPYVIAQRLHDDGSYDPDGELIAFSDRLSPRVREVDVVGDMALTFVARPD